MSPATTRVSRGVTFDNFDPNKQFSEQPLWGHFDGYKFKTFTARGHAINAFHASSQSKLYKQGPNGWEEIAVKTHTRPTTCADCGATTMTHPEHYNYRQQQTVVDTSRTINAGNFEFRRGRGGKIADPLELVFMCKACREMNG